ncbi:hypothetical protein B5X24_HaOG200703 [Helicoverpa armigera]|uniref:Gustatory receptor n=1 Tax=Helicoverpa armigera TaxID=29058 RepID=A0A2W1BTU4_HELAM|nr:hypothetical protein B5X24_HaOG200703 [Helicoverpa armigera]
MFQSLNNVKHKQKIPRNILNFPPEVCLNNYLEKEIQNIFRPFNYAFILLLSSKYTMQDNYITPNGKLRTFLSCMSASYVSGVGFYYMISNKYLEYNSSVYSITVVTIVVQLIIIGYCFGVILIMVNNFVFSQKNILLIVTIQTIGKNINLSKVVKNFIVGNWIAILIPSAIYAGIQGSFYIFYYIIDYTLVLATLCTIAFLAFELELVYALRVIVLLRKYLQGWVQMVSKLNYDQDDGYDCVKLFKIYQNILQAFELYKAVSQFLVIGLHLLSSQKSFLKRTLIL